MKRFTEAEINSCTRRFLIENGFNFLSTKNNGEKFYYRLNKSSPPLLKQPDCLAYKENVVIIWEEKVKFNDLFKTQNGKVSDIDKLGNILNDIDLRYEFLIPIADVLKMPLESIILLGGVNSLTQKETSSKIIPEIIIHLETEIDGNSTKTRILKCPDSIIQLIKFKESHNEL